MGSNENSGTLPQDDWVDIWPLEGGALTTYLYLWVTGFITYNPTLRSYFTPVRTILGAHLATNFEVVHDIWWYSWKIGSGCPNRFFCDFD